MANPYAIGLADSGLDQPSASRNDVGGQIHLLLATLRDSYTGSFAGGAANPWTEIIANLRQSAGDTPGLRIVLPTLVSYETRWAARR